MVDTSLAQLAAWRSVGLELTLSVDVSVRDLSDGRLVEHVTASLDRHGVPPSACSRR